MNDYLNKLPTFVEAIESMKEIIITNVVLIGQTNAPTFKEKRRTTVFMERLADFQVDECTTDGYRNPIGIIRGTSESKPPIFVVAHIDTPAAQVLHQVGPGAGIDQHQQRTAPLQIALQRLALAALRCVTYPPGFHLILQTRANSVIFRSGPRSLTL